MSSVLIDINIKNKSHIPTAELRSVCVAVIAKAIMDGRKVPDKVVVHTEQVPLRRRIGGYTILRTGELCFSDKNPMQHIIRVVTGKRAYEDIIQTLFHELGHLIRIANGEVEEEPSTEEDGNKIQMYKTLPAVHHLTAILILDGDGSLRKIWDEKELNATPGTVVR